MSFSGAFYMEGAPEYEQRSGGSRGKHVSAALRMARQSCCGRGAQRSGGRRLCEWRGRVVADVARKEAAEAVVSAERGFANGAAEVLRTDARVLLRNNPVVDTPAAGCYI